MLKEVRLFAAINDLHIIRYNHSWLEVSEAKAEKSEGSSPGPQKKDAEASFELKSPYIGFAPGEGSAGSHSGSSHGESFEGRESDPAPS